MIPKSSINFGLFSMRIPAVSFILCKTVGLEIFYKEAVITLVEINFGRKKNDKYFSNRSISETESAIINIHFHCTVYSLRQAGVVKHYI